MEEQSWNREESKSWEWTKHINMAFKPQTSDVCFPGHLTHYITIIQHHGDLWPVRLRSPGLWFVAVQQFDLVKVSRFDHLIVQMQPFTFGLATRRKESPRILVVLPSSRQHEVCSVNHSTSPLILHLYHLKNITVLPERDAFLIRRANMRHKHQALQRRCGRERTKVCLRNDQMLHIITTFMSESHETSKKHDVFIQNQQEEINDIFALRKWWLF